MKTNTKSFRRIVCTFAATLLLPFSSMASILLYDGFDYPAGSLVGRNDGEGFKTAWANSGTASSSTLNTSGSSYSDTSGNNLLTGGGKVVVSATDTSGVYRTFDPITAASGTTTTFWLSFVGSTTGVWTQGGGGYSAALILRNGDTELLAIGAFGTTDAWRVRANNASYSPAPGVPSSSTEAFVVVRIDVDTTTGGNDSVYMWLNPDIGGAAPSISTAAGSITGTNLWNDGAFSLNLLRIGTIDGGAKTAKGIALDELRLGTDFASVTPQAVPEPATLAMLFGGIVLFTTAVFRRHRA
ncbi:PEP-CTERM sorting domain-containing protein [Opitutaceae bacterium TAV4]|nr:PEP-CTERM sorting domain-containing protein [Opitutaceae bacterium TAV4]RRJ98888.1 PEP-CTERM sorting domain-containing protein [Opitutaceae bacterium TAV3]